MLVIIALETKNKNGSDFYYLKSILTRFYEERGTGIAIKHVFMNGKANYDKIEAKIKNIRNQYQGNSVVVYFCDVDKPELRIDQKQLNNKIINYCKNKNYKLVWFNKTIEDVLIDKLINNDKTNIAYNFYIKDLINNVPLNRLNCGEKPTVKQSNILTILDEYLIKKNR